MGWFHRRPADAAPTLDAIAAQLDRIEAEMRRIGYWSDDPPDLRRAVVEGRVTGPVDAPSFELWLQALFLPNARDAVASDTLPDESAVGLMAMRQYDYHAYVPEAQDLLALLRAFDAMVERRVAARR